MDFILLVTLERKEGKKEVFSYLKPIAYFLFEILLNSDLTHLTLIVKFQKGRYWLLQNSYRAGMEQIRSSCSVDQLKESTI